MKSKNGWEICPRCKRKYDLDVELRPQAIRKWNENGKTITNKNYVCTCGGSFERTEKE